MQDQAQEDIWLGDLLDRQREAFRIENYIRIESAELIRTGREKSVVLAIDAPYGRGKTWFISRLTKQLRISHPIAFIDAWAEDVGDEPLAAFMVAIEDALSPYLTKKSKITSSLNAVKSAAIPILGKLASGAMTKALTKLAGDEIDEQIGDALDQAIRGKFPQKETDESSTAAQVTEAGIEAAAKEIESLADRRGATVLAAYRQKRDSRVRFRQTLNDLVDTLESDDTRQIKPPLIVVIDELDRCRPIFAIKMLEEIKHFFEVKNVVFIISLYGDQLTKSVKAVYGSEFDSEDYLRRFFTRTYNLSEQPIENLVISLFAEWEIQDKIFYFPQYLEDSEKPMDARTAAGKILNDFGATPRETFSVIDCLRLFASQWDNATTIDLIVILIFCLQTVRNTNLFLDERISRNQLSFKGISWEPSGNSGTPTGVTISGYVRALQRYQGRRLDDLIGETSRNRDAALNIVIQRLKSELEQIGNTDQIRQYPLAGFNYYPLNLQSLSGFFQDS